MMKNAKFLLVIPIILAIAVAFSGCANNTPGQTNTPSEEDRAAPVDPPIGGTPAQLDQEPGSISITETPDRLEVRLTQTPPKLGRVEIPEDAPDTGEVPTEIMEQILADLVDRTDAKADEIKVIRAEAVVWNDGSLGCPKPGELYIQMLINGYWVVLGVEGGEYDYRVSDKGHFTLCEGTPISPPVSGLTPDQ